MNKLEPNSVYDYRLGLNGSLTTLIFYNKRNPLRVIPPVEFIPMNFSLNWIGHRTYV